MTPSRIDPNPGKKNPAMSAQGYSNSSNADEENLFKYILSNDRSEESLLESSNTKKDRLDFSYSLSISLVIYVQ